MRRGARVGLLFLSTGKTAEIDVGSWCYRREKNRMRYATFRSLSHSNIFAISFVRVRWDKASTVTQTRNSPSRLQPPRVGDLGHPTGCLLSYSTFPFIFWGALWVGSLGPDLRLASPCQVDMEALSLYKVCIPVNSNENDEIGIFTSTACLRPKPVFF